MLVQEPSATDPHTDSAHDLRVLLQNIPGKKQCRPQTSTKYTCSQKMHQQNNVNLLMPLFFLSLSLADFDCTQMPPHGFVRCAHYAHFIISIPHPLLLYIYIILVASGFLFLVAMPFVLVAKNQKKKTLCIILRLCWKGTAQPSPLRGRRVTEVM